MLLSRLNSGDIENIDHRGSGYFGFFLSSNEAERAWAILAIISKSRLRFPSSKLPVHVRSRLARKASFSYA